MFCFYEGMNIYIFLSSMQADKHVKWHFLSPLYNAVLQTLSVPGMFRFVILLEINLAAFLRTSFPVTAAASLPVVFSFCDELQSSVVMGDGCFRLQVSKPSKFWLSFCSSFFFLFSCHSLLSCILAVCCGTKSFSKFATGEKAEAAITEHYVVNTDGLFQTVKSISDIKSVVQF